MFKMRYVIISMALFALGCSTSHFISADETMKTPKLIEKPLFIYPHTAQKNNLSGKVHLIIKIDKSGKVDSIMVEKSSGHNILDRSAIAFVKQFRYKPAELNGQPIHFYLKQSVDYLLEENSDPTNGYIKQIKKLRKKIEKASPERQLELQKELLAVYKDYINANLDFIIFNQNITDLINQNAYDRWSESIEDWPLHFLVFDDFQKSYPGSPLNTDARNL
ncbi:MAG: energy transducer TonB, partial [Calditrichaceae bacterium]|nr:energy transducer TonB [Calditrichaceae bacterium]